jgi:acyl carrier protein
VDRYVLPTAHTMRPLLASASMPLQSETEDNFFDLGGDSLKITKMTALIRRNMGKEMSLTIVFKKPTLRELADYIASIT